MSASRLRPTVGIVGARGLVGSVATGIAGQAILVATGVISARLLGPEDRGWFALVVLLPSLIAPVGSLGVPFALAYELSQPAVSRRIDRALSIACLQALAAVAIELAVVVIASQAVPAHVLPAAFVALWCGPFLLLQQYALAVLQGTRRYAQFNVLRAMPAGVYAACLIPILLLPHPGLLAVAVAWTGGTSIGCLLTIFVAAKRWRAVIATSDEEADHRPDLVRRGLTGLLGWLSPVDTFRIDQLVAGTFLSATALGYYVVGSAFTNLPRFIGQSTGMIAFPEIAAASITARPGRAWTYVAIAGGLCLLTVAPLIVLADQLVELFFGPTFQAAVPVARILLVGACLSGTRKTTGDVLRGLSRPGAATMSEVASYAVLGLMLVALVPPLGLQGVAWAVTASAGAGLLVAVVQLAGLTLTRSVGRAIGPVQSRVA